MITFSLSSSQFICSVSVSANSAFTLLCRLHSPAFISSLCWLWELTLCRSGTLVEICLNNSLVCAVFHSPVNLSSFRLTPKILEVVHWSCRLVDMCLDHLLVIFLVSKLDFAVLLWWKTYGAHKHIIVRNTRVCFIIAPQTLWHVQSPSTHMTAIICQ